MITTINELALGWYRYFGPALVQNTIFLAVVFLALYWLRHARAGIRYAVGLVGVVKLLLPPFLPIGVDAGEAYFNIAALTIPVASPPTVVAPASAAAAESLTVIGAFFTLWVLVAAAYLLFATGSFLRLALQLRGAATLDDDKTIGSEGLRIRSSDEVAVPLTLWLFPQTIFVPVDWERWSRRSRRAVVRHEAAHMRRRDGIAQALQLLARSIYFFHPLVALLGRRLNEYREMACDDASVDPSTHSRVSYSRCLVEIAEDLARRSAVCDSASALLRRHNELRCRIEYQLREKNMVTVSRSRATMLFVVLVAAVVAFSWYPSTVSSSSKGDRPTVEVSIDAAKGGDVVRVNGKKTSMKHFDATMESALPENREGVIVDIVCDEEAAVETLFLVQQRLVALDLLKVRFSNLSGRDIPHVLPSPEMMEKLKSIDPKHISTLEITADGNVVIDGEEVANAEFVDVVKKKHTANPLLIVSVYTDPQTRYGDFVRVLSALRKAEAKRVTINISYS